MTEWSFAEIGLIDGDNVEAYRPLVEHHQVESRWVKHCLSLQEWSGRRVRLRFISDCGTKGNSTTDHSYWGDAVVLGAGGREALTGPERHMTWLGQRSFASGFYFPEVRSKTVDLEWIVEGPQAVWIESLKVYAQADIMVREFDHGIVIANPSPRSCQIDVARRWPEASLRRLSGSPRQDPKTNDGQPVTGKVELGPLDALFLVKD